MGTTFPSTLVGLLLASIVSQCLTAQAANFKLSFDPKKTCSAIEIRGAIKAGDYEKFVKVLKQATARAPLRRIYLNSEGGQVLTAIAITEVIRNTAPTVETIVQSRHACNSACNIILSVGSTHNVSRYATLNIHQVFDEKTGKRDAVLTREIGQYLALNGMPPDVLSTMSNLSPKQILTITPSNAKRLGFGSFNFYRSTNPPATAQCSWRGITLKRS
jgi:hypothetical protein